MESGAIHRSVDVAPVAAYPRAALDQYLSEARLIADDLRAKITAEQRRRDAALLALERASDAHRALGALLVSATAELGGTRARAERDAEAIAEGDCDPGERFGHLPEPPSEPPSSLGSAPLGSPPRAVPDPEGPRRWVLARREAPDHWPYNEGAGDESFFVRLRDELRADGTLSWFEPA